ncbi:MAG: flagellar filament capping protein FliD [Oscillospiraceae bacterium]|nr:flagellar filament capping protein FliD [Oscillospiraceae bacterium]
MSTITNSTNRVAGLMSGLETEELVKAMTANTKMRINSQKQKIQTLQWKQEAYRSVISKISDFQKKYLDILSPTSIKANAVMKKFKAESSNTKYVTASASANATPGKYTISKTTAATKATITSKNGSVASGDVKLDFSKAKDGASYTVEINLDGASKKVTFNGGGSEGVTKANFLDAVNEAFADVKGTKQKFDFIPGTNSLYFNGNGDGITHTFSVGYCSGLGLANPAYNMISTSSTLAGAGFATKLKTDTGTYDITINGVDFSFKENTTISQMMSTINNSKAGVKISFSNISQTFTIETKETGAAASLSVTQSSGNLLNAMFGLDENVAEPKAADTTLPMIGDADISYLAKVSRTLGDNLAEQLKNGFEEGKGTYEMIYVDKDGMEHKLKLDLSKILYKDGEGAPYSDSVITMAFNQAFQEAAAEEGLKDVGDIFSYTSATDKDGKYIATLTVEADGCGVDFRTEVSEQIDETLINALNNGFENADDLAEYTLSYTDSKGVKYDLKLDLKAALEGIEPEGEGNTYTKEQIEKIFSTAATEAYKKATNMSEEDAEDFSIDFTYSETTDDEGNTVRTLTRDDAVNDDFNLLNNVNKTIGYADSSHVISDADKMTFTVNHNDEEYTIEIIRDGKNITILRDGAEIYSGANEKEGITAKNLIDAGLVRQNKDGSLTAIKDATATDDGAKAFLEKYFASAVDPETGDYTIERARIGELETANGTNSTITISSDDGKTFATYASTDNTFNFDGTTITISGDFNAESEDDYLTIEVSKDSSGIKDVITGFIEDYNNLLADLYGEITTSRPKSSGSYYDPLTEEQEDEMSDKEIEKWNENAKQGLIYQDKNVQKFLSELRGVMNTRVDGFGLADLGIRLTESWADHGKLELKYPEKLDSAIEDLGDKLANLFTGENGLASKLENVCDRAVSTKTNKYGYLSSLAGIEGTKTDKDNQIYKQIDYIQKVIERLNDKYEREQERYWRKYSALETMMQRAQTQMSYFTDFGSNNGGY